MNSAPRFWFDQNIIAWSLLPVALLFCAVVFLRRQLYRWRIAVSHHIDLPVVIVGNIAVGGTGKTPLLIAICERLKQLGMRPGIVSRGYGSSIEGPHLVTSEDTASMVGDEPLLLARRTGVPVVIAAQRVAAAKMLVDRGNIDIILSDDGLQHYSLARDAEIAVVDANWMHGNGFCLPAGPLREPVSRLGSVDVTVYNDVSDDGKCGFELEPSAVINLATGESRSLESFSGSTAHAVAGIGHPMRFFARLRNSGIEVIEHAFGDHHAFTRGELGFDDGLPILMTEKDAVKCTGFDLGDTWYVAVDARLNDKLTRALEKLVGKLIDG